MTLEIKECPKCKGSGTTDGWRCEETCWDCEGNGVLATGDLAEPIMKLIYAILRDHCRIKHP